MKKKNILFVCRHNIFRSRVAEAYFKKINKNKNINVASAGIIKMDLLPKKDNKIIQLQRKIAREFGIDVIGKSKPLTTSSLMKQDIIIIVADNVPKSLFNIKSYFKPDVKIIRYKIRDVKVQNKNMVEMERNITKIIKKIMRKMDWLAEELK